MSKTFFFYDLETTGLNPRYDRIMQFAGQRTDMDLNPIGEPINWLVKLSDDILPSPEALLVTGITPQMTLSDGFSEAEFCAKVAEEVFTPDTIALGYNTVRFDDEFIRHTFWRSFLDPYEWSWSEGRGRWDMLDVVRLVRALRPEGINWPTSDDGAPVNKLELLSKANNLTHIKAHDALSDVVATIDVARLIKKTQPKMFDYLFKMRKKENVQKLVNLENPQAFVYASGRYGSANNFTTIAFPIAPGKTKNSVLVYDLRFNSLELDEDQALPVKEMAYNRCPAVAPLSVMNEAAWNNINLDEKTVKQNLKNLNENKALVDSLIDKYRKNIPDFPEAEDVEGRLYDSFTPEADKAKIRAVRSADANDLADFHPNFVDERLSELLLRYKARNFPQTLSDSEAKLWQEYRHKKFQKELPEYNKILAEKIAATDDKNQQFILDEIRLFVESILPLEDFSK